MFYSINSKNWWEQLKRDERQLSSLVSYYRFSTWFWKFSKYIRISFNWKYLIQYILILFPHFLISIRSYPPPSHPTSYSFFLSLKRKPHRDKQNQNRQKIRKYQSKTILITYKHTNMHVFSPFISAHMFVYICIYACVWIYVHTCIYAWTYL